MPENLSDYTLAQLHRQSIEYMIRDVYGFIMPDAGQARRQERRTAPYVVGSGNRDRIG